MGHGENNTTVREDPASVISVSGPHPPVENRRQAYASLIQSLEPTLLRQARRLAGGDEDTAQDLVQEAFIRGYKAYIAGQFIEGTNARAWLLRILTNYYLTEHSRRRKWIVPETVDALTADGQRGGPEFQAAPMDQPGQALLASTLDEQLEFALQMLSRDLRACVLLVDVEGMEYAEAARALAIPIGTVRSRLARARLQLHALLYDYARDHRRL